ncbi:MAG: methyl-accepting chemotaxis protein [Spirochaetales bacterium]|nr:methyl-accepting chemotaxis protein [Spirochaetales bacterium]
MSGKITIGFMTKSMRTPVGFSMWNGAVRAARELDINIITLDGNNLGRDGSQIYHLLKKSNVDGVLAWASNKMDEFAPFYKEQLAGMPLVTLTQPIYDFPFVKIDSYETVKLSVKHFVEKHGYRKIAFILGDNNNALFTERFQAYKDSLKELGIPYDPDLVTTFEGNPDHIMKDFTYSQLNTLIHERNKKPGKDFQAIMTVSEKMSLRIFDYFEEKGISIPDDVALISYDNSSAGRYRTPSPTAMILPFEDQAARGVKLLVDKIKGENISRENSIPGYLEINQSCGCEEKSKDLVNSYINYNLPAPSRRNKIVEKELAAHEISQNISARFILHMKEQEKKNSAYIDQLEGMIGKFIPATIKDLGSEQILSVNSLKELIHYYNDYKISTELLQDLITFTREELIRHINNISSIEQLERLINIYRTEISSSLTYFQGLTQTRNETLQENLQQFIRLLSSQQTYKGIYESIEKRIGFLEIQDFHLVLYPKLLKDFKTDKLPELSEYALGISHGKKINIKEKNFPTENILPKSVLGKINIHNMLILPLVPFGESIGYVIFQGGPDDRILYSTLKDQIANTLRAAYDRKKLQEAEMTSARALETLKQKAEVITQNTQSINALIQAISSSMSKISDKVQLISTDVLKVSEESTTVVEVTDQTNKFVDDLDAKAQEITSIINLISDISEKTNVLSINARIEAARAGASGKGFTVVANEIKNLSEQTNKSTEQISGMIGEMLHGSGNTLQSMARIHSIIQKINSLTENINGKIEEHLEATRQISAQLTEASSGSQEIFSAISEVAAQG